MRQVSRMRITCSLLAHQRRLGCEQALQLSEVRCMQLQGRAGQKLPHAVYGGCGHFCPVQHLETGRPSRCCNSCRRSLACVDTL